MPGNVNFRSFLPQVCILKSFKYGKVERMVQRKPMYLSPKLPVAKILPYLLYLSTTYYNFVLAEPFES